MGEDLQVGPTEPPMLKTMYQAINQANAVSRAMLPTKRKSQQVLPKVSSYYDPDQGVEYWFDPQAGQWYYHYPTQEAEAAAVAKNSYGIDPSTQVEVVQN